MPADTNAGAGLTLTPELVPGTAEQQALQALARATALACQAKCCALATETTQGAGTLTLSGELTADAQDLVRDFRAFVQARESLFAAQGELILQEHLPDSDPLRETSFIAARQLCDPQGQLVGLMALFEPVDMAEPRPTEMLALSTDTMAQAIKELLAHHWYYDAYINSPALLYTTDEDGFIEEVSQLWLTQFGYRREDVIGRQPTDFMTASARDDLAGFANHIHLTAGVKDFPSQFVTAGGRAIDVLMSIALERQSDGRATKASMKSKCLLVDITLQIQIQRALEARARLDEMTGVPNRAWIRERFQVEAARAARYKRPLSLVMFDADHFKQLNDEHGHAAGDHALVLLANTARHQLRGADEVGRIGGEEFALVLPETDLAGGLHVAERLREGVASLPLKEVGLPCPLTISLGVVEVDPNSTTDQAFACADAAMYEAKRTGRNRVVAWHAALPAHPNAANKPETQSLESQMGPLV
ncbi:MAG: GGDEF domain-containing protein [Burkholderiaceae bacterium]